MPNKRIPKTPIIIFTEGQCEENYIKSLLNDIKIDKFKFDIKSLKGGNYSSFIEELEQLRGTEEIVFVVADLDRAANDANELKNLEKVVSKLEYINEYCNAFFTYENFETFLSAHFDKFKKNIVKALGYSDTKNMKSKADAYERIKNKGGDYKNTIKHFQSDMYFCKKDFKFPKKLNANNLSNRQSGLIYLVEYIKFLAKKL